MKSSLARYHVAVGKNYNGVLLQKVYCASFTEFTSGRLASCFIAESVCESQPETTRTQEHLLREATGLRRGR
jgi:hypothetical protein